MTKELYRERIANGLCGKCGKPVDNGRSNCEECLANHRVTAIKRYYSNIASHKCGHCGRELPPDYYFVLCDICKERQKSYEKKSKRSAKNTVPCMEVIV